MPEMVSINAYVLYFLFFASPLVFGEFFIQLLLIHFFKIDNYELVLGYGVGHRTSEVHLGAQSQIANMYFVGFLKVESYIVFWVDPSF